MKYIPPCRKLINYTCLWGLYILYVIYLLVFISVLVQGIDSLLTVDSSTNKIYTKYFYIKYVISKSF